MTCPACGTAAPDDAKFCPACGHGLLARHDERRVATVLFADLVGFTTFSESADPEHVKNLVERCFEGLSADVSAYGGQVDKIVGDALVALFGAPIAHEDDAERAVRCALQMQRTLARLRDSNEIAVEMRIGVNTGEVLVGALRAGGDYTAMGDVVNTASRLQTAARPGQVVAGGSTHDATRRAVRYDSLGAIVVKGRAEPVDAWVALEALAAPGQRRRARTPLVGREPELALLRGIVDAAIARQRAHLVVLTGDAGVGKSRLAGEVTSHASTEHGACVLAGPCVPYGEDIWWPIAETIREVCEVATGATHEESQDRVSGHVAFAMGRAADDAEVERTTRGLLYLLGFADELHDVDPGRARDDAVRSAQALYGYLAKKQPLVLTLSDLHWADEHLLDLVDRLLQRLRTLPFVLLVTARPELQDRWRPEPGRHDLSVLNLEPLDADAVATLVDELLGADATPQLVSLLHERSGGNPFFVEELIALIRESGGGATGLEAGRLPATLQGLVAARLDTLDPPARNLLEDCAVVGSSGSVEAVQALAEAREGGRDPDIVLRELADRELVELRDGEYAFESEVVRDVAYGTLTKAERARRHAVLGDWMAERTTDDDATIVTERVAHHYGVAAMLLLELGSVPGVDADLPGRALRALERAAGRARASEVWRSAERLYDQALAILPPDTPDETRWRLLLGRGRARAEQRELAGAREDVDEVLDDAPDDEPTVARALTLLADIQQMGGEPDASIATFERALELWRTLGDEQGMAEALRGRGLTAMFTSDLDSADGFFVEALTAFRRVGDRRGEAWTLQNLATISFFRGDSEKADDRLDRAVASFTELGDWGGLLWAMGVRAWVRFMQGRLDEAEALATEVIPEAEATGNRWIVGILSMLLGSLALWAGRPLTAVARGEEAVARFHAIGDAWGEAQSTAVLVRALGAAGRLEDALDALDAASARSHAAIDWNIEALMRAQVLVHAGAPDALPAALHANKTANTPPGFDRERSLVLGLAMLQACRVTEAIAELQLAKSHLADAEGGPAIALSAALAIAYAADGRSDDALALVDEGGDTGTYMDQLQRALGRAFALLRAGDSEAPAAFDELVDRLDETEACLDQAIVRLARARAWAVLGRADADDAERDARARLAALGIEAPGWDALFREAAG